MSFSIGISMALIAMFCWGIADFLQALVIKKIGSLKTMFFGNLIGLLPSILFFIYFFAAGKIHIDLLSFLLLFFAGAIDVFGVYNFMKSFELGDISVVTPISASYSLITVILAFLFLGEALSFLKMVSVVIITLGIILVSTDIKKLKNLHTAKGVKESLIALFVWGVYFFILGFISKRLLAENIAVYGLNMFDAKVSVAINLFFFTNLINGSLMALFSGIKEKNRAFSVFKTKNILLFFLINFALYNIAWIAVNYGIAQDLVSIVTPVSSLYPALTVLLAWFFLKEKLVLNQKIGILFTLLGIFLISL